MNSKHYDEMMHMFECLRFKEKITDNYMVLDLDRHDQMELCKKIDSYINKLIHPDNLSGESRRLGYDSALLAVAYFLTSGKRFDEWYSKGPLSSAWFNVLEALGREEEYENLIKKRKHEDKNRGIEQFFET